MQKISNEQKEESDDDVNVSEIAESIQQIESEQDGDALIYSPIPRPALRPQMRSDYS